MLMHLYTLMPNGSNPPGAVFRADGTEFFGISVVMTRDDWIKQGRPTWVDLNIGRD
jgi:hypothetical protein